MFTRTVATTKEISFLTGQMQNINKATFILKSTLAYHLERPTFITALRVGAQCQWTGRSSSEKLHKSGWTSKWYVHSSVASDEPSACPGLLIQNRMHWSTNPNKTFGKKQKTAATENISNMFSKCEKTHCNADIYWSGWRSVCNTMILDNFVVLWGEINATLMSA